jgi:hypothetical protein
MMAVQVERQVQVPNPVFAVAGADLPRRRGRLRALLASLFLTSSGLAVPACGVTEAGNLPPGVVEPDVPKTASGAVARYRGALATLPSAFDAAMLAGALLTDELAGLPIGFGGFGIYTNLDSRQSPAFNPSRFHRLRAEAREARGFLVAYAPASSPALRGHLFALEGYAELYLADLFCSGIPLSTVDFEGNYTLAPGSSTTEVYRHAVTLFDSALALSGDSVRLQPLAAVGRGRALLALGQYADAADAVAAVPTEYTYQTIFTFVKGPGFSADSASLWSSRDLSTQQESGLPSVADQEGINGLPYRTSGDPRTRATPAGDMYFPDKYAPSSPVTFTVASGIEARLIEAEAALRANAADGQWLALLNQLRETAWATIVPTPASPPETLEDPGVAVSDPAAATRARVDLLFRERAFWLFLTGHRQGDLRRLIRQYGRLQEEVYPTGFYPAGLGTYGAEVVIPMPETERTLNPNYTGCIDRNA